MQTTRTSFVLLESHATGEPFSIHELANGPTYLTDTARGDLRVSRRPARSRPVVVIEPIQRGRRGALLMLSARGVRVRVHGELAPPVALLGERDEFALGRHRLAVSKQLGDGIDTAGPLSAGLACPFCRLGFTVGRTIWICPQCAATLHCDPDNVAEDQRLDCARRTANCTACGNPIRLQGALAWSPEA